MERTLIGSRVAMSIKGNNVTVGYISSARQRSKQGRLFFGDIVLDDKYAKFKDVKVINHEYDYEHPIESNHAKIINVTTYIEGIE